MVNFVILVCIPIYLGESLGTGDVFLRKRDALRAVKTFEGVALDNEILRMVIVDNGRTVSGRVSFISPRRVGTGAIQKKRLQNGQWFQFSLSPFFQIGFLEKITLCRAVVLAVKDQSHWKSLMPNWMLI